MEKLGIYLEEVRKEKGLKQEEVAREIGYEQYQVSRAEKGTSRDLKLYISICHYFELDLKKLVLSNYLNKSQLEYILLAQEDIKELARQQKYKEMGASLKRSWKNPAFRKTDPSFLYWYQGIYDFYHGNDFDLAHKNLLTAVNLSSTLHPERQYEIKNTLGVICLENNDPKQAKDVYEESITSLKDIKNFRHPQIMIRLLLNLSTAYYELEDYSKCISACLEAIDTCNENHCSYLKGEIYYQLGLCHYKLGDIQETARNMKTAVFYLREQKQEALIEQIRLKGMQWGLGHLTE